MIQKPKKFCHARKRFLITELRKAEAHNKSAEQEQMWRAYDLLNDQKKCEKNSIQKSHQAVIGELKHRRISDRRIFEEVHEKPNKKKSRATVETAKTQPNRTNKRQGR